MLMSVFAREQGFPVYPELAGARVLITGLTSKTGVDVARAFAEHKARLVLQSLESSPEMTALGTVIAEAAADLKVFDDPVTSADDAIRFAQDPAQAYGGLDAVINLVSIGWHDFAGRERPAEIEDVVSAKLSAAMFITRVVANRMRLMMTEGLILNIVGMPAPNHAREAALADVVHAGLAAMTRGEASQWAEQAIRINAIGPRCAATNVRGGACLASEPDIAALALYLASKKGRGLSGHVFDAEDVAARRC
jgi:3-oxoacyl-[acyl-carrier protein] reductase